MKKMVKDTSIFQELKEFEKFQEKRLETAEKDRITRTEKAKESSTQQLKKLEESLEQEKELRAQDAANKAKEASKAVTAEYQKKEQALKGKSKKNFNKAVEAALSSLLKE